jgi:sugar lactone lactonase YvrE
VTVYPPGSISPSKTLTGAGVPVRVAVDANGTVYVASFNNVRAAPYYGPGYVLAYRKGATKPSKTIVAFDDKRTVPLGLALDAAGDLFVAFNQPCIGCRDQQGNNVGEVLVFPPGVSTGKNLGIRVDYAISCTVDRSGNLLLLDQHQFAGDTWDVDVFPPGSKRAIRHIDLGFRSITDLALDGDNDTLWVSWFGFSLSTVFQLAYPSGSMIDSFAAGSFAAGIATSPAGSP